MTGSSYGNFQERIEQAAETAIKRNGSAGSRFWPS
jgi:hypothetical protein